MLEVEKPPGNVMAGKPITEVSEQLYW
jgi:hypothetical protein